MAVVNELVTRFSFVGDLAPQRDFNKGLAQSVTLLGGAATALTAAAGGFFAWATSVLDGIDPLAQLNRETGVAVERIQELGYAASVNGSSADALTGSFREMSKRLGEFVQTGGGPAKEIIDKLGISVRDAEGNVRSADDVFLGLSGTLQDMSRSEQANVLDKLGIDQSLIQLVSLSSEEVGKLTDRARTLGVVTQEQADSAAAFNDSLTTLKYGMSAIQNSVAVGFAPAMTGLIDRFVTFIEVNGELIQGGLTWLGEVLVAVMGFMERMAPIVLGVAAAFTIAWFATGGFATVLGLVLSPAVLITAAIVALLLIVDDLIAAFQGGESVIADFFNEFLGIDIVPIMRGIYDAFMGMINGVIALFSTLWDAWSQLITAIIQVFTGDWEGALSSLLGAFNSLGEAIKLVFSGVFDFLFNAMSQVFGAIKSAATSLLPDWALRLIGGGSSDMPSGSPAIAPNEAMAIGSSGGSSVSNSIEQQVQINVSSNDPKAAGAAVNDALQDQLKTAKTQVNRGGR